MRRAAVIGLGATGSHVARQLRSSGVQDLLLSDEDRDRQQEVTEALGVAASTSARSLARAEVVVIATPAGTHVAIAQRALTNGSHVVSLSDAIEDVEGLLALDSVARQAGRTLLVGAGFAPGLTCLLVRHAADALDEVDEIAVVKAGTAGPACARQHHRAMKGDARDWVDGAWEPRRGGSGRELAWFPPPVGARDSYKAALPSPLLLQRRYPGASRIAARVSATRRDRLTFRLPMLRPPHQDGGPGAVRVEVRGHRSGSYETLVYAVMHHPSFAAGTVAATAALQLTASGVQAGSLGLAEIADPMTLLRSLHDRGIRPATFDGSRAA